MLSASLPHMVHITEMLHLRQNMSLLRAHNAFCTSLISCVSPAGYSTFRGFSGGGSDWQNLSQSPWDLTNAPVTTSLIWQPYEGLINKICLGFLHSSELHPPLVFPWSKSWNCMRVQLLMLQLNRLNQWLRLSHHLCMSQLHLKIGHMHCKQVLLSFCK